MFTNTILKENIKLVDTSFSLKENGLLPDTYVIDLDQLEINARAIFNEAEKQGVKLYFMLKQIGRNPLIAKKLIEIGYSGAVCVDFKDALVMKKNNIPIGHMGHLVQIPDCLIETFLKYGVEIITVFSVDKLLKINETAKKLGLVQNISLRIYGDGDNLYDGQQCGFSDSEVLDIANMSTRLSNVKICGLTTFPCFLYDEKQKKVLPTKNMIHEQRLAKLLEEKGLKIQYINAPSATMTETLKMFKEFGANVGEPGHALTGTTPMHAEFSLPEKIAYTYVTEISHNFMGDAFCYGGGLYRRGHAQYAIMKENGEYKKEILTAVNAEAIDYHFKIDGEKKVGDTVLITARTQIFVTRSDVAVVSGIQTGNIKIEGIFDSQGEKKI